jgi:Glycosyltransferase
VAHQKLCIVSDIKENREVLGDLPEKCFFSPYDSDDLIKKIIFWIKEDLYAMRIAKKNYLRIKNKFSIQKLVRLHREAYNELLGSEKGL